MLREKVIHVPGEVEDYEAAQGLRWSQLKELRTSPLHFHHHQEHPRQQTAAMRLGSAVDCAIFEPERFGDRFIVYTESKTTGEGARKRWQEFQKEHAHQSILSLEDDQYVTAISSAVLQNQHARELLEVGRAQVGFTWQDPSGIVGKGKLDWLTGQTAIVDLKTGARIGEYHLGSHAWELGYFHQFAYYRRGLSVALGCEAYSIPIFVIAAETDPPFDVGVLRVDDESLAVASADVEQLLAKYLDCLERGWPGQYPDVGMLRAPHWALADDLMSVDVEVS